MASFIPDFTDPNTLNSLNPSNQTNNLDSEGFSVPAAPMGDGTGLPSSKVDFLRTGTFTRDIIHWFVPEFGIVKMYVNPNNIAYRHKKLITRDRTKGGYTLQYWGEDLTVLTLSGTTGSSGVEGINVLNEIYRAEQLAFDAVGLSLAADNAAIGASNQIISGIGNAVGSEIGSAVGGGSDFGGSVGGLLGAGIANGVFGTDQFTSLAPRNIASLASLAFGVEMYYGGWVYRGFFDDMSIREMPVGIFEYDITFTTTQRRGYRLNQMPFNRSAISGPSNNSEAGGVPFSFRNISG